MKLRLFLVPAVCLGLLVFSAAPARPQTIVTFDDLHETGTGSLIPYGYEGLIWSNVWCFNAILATNRSEIGVNGYYFGMVSASNNAHNAFNGDAEVDSVTNFNFLSTYLTGAWNSNLNVEVQGFRDTNLVYDATKVVSATTPTPFTFDYLDIDRLYFSSFGGEPAFGTAPGYQFVMDNFMFEFVPEPSTFLLAALGAVSLVAFLGRKRA